MGIKKRALSLNRTNHRERVFRRQAAHLGHIAKARGMTEIAKASGIKREALYKALRPNTRPRLETIQRVFKALGLKLTATTAH